MIFLLSVPLQLRPVEVHLAQIARSISLRLIVEMLGRRIAALAARRHRHCMHRLTELHHRHKAVPATPIPLLRSWVPTRSKRRQRPPRRRSEPYRYAWPSVTEGLHDVAGKPLESIDIAPRCLPASEIR